MEPDKLNTEQNLTDDRDLSQTNDQSANRGGFTDEDETTTVSNEIEEVDLDDEDLGDDELVEEDFDEDEDEEIS